MGSHLALKNGTRDMAVVLTQRGREDEEGALPTLVCTFDVLKCGLKIFTKNWLLSVYRLQL
jgi:hypothetical protein